jgi:hypothetical protein
MNMNKIFQRYSRKILLRKAFKKFTLEPTNSNISDAHFALSKSLEPFTSKGIVYSGWVSGSLRFKLNKSALERLNPNFRVTIRRFIRKELLHAFRVHGLRPGFEVTFILRRDKADTPLEALMALVNVENVPILPTGSSRDTEFVIRKMQDQAEKNFPSQFTKIDGLFYLDKAKLLAPASFFDQNWLLANVDSVIDLLRYLKDPECAKRLSEFLPEVAISMRQLKKIDFLINGTGSVKNGEFEILEIDRHLSNLDQKSAQPFVKPQKNKKKVSFVNTVVDLAVPLTGFTELKSVIVYEGCQVKQNKKLILIEDAADPIRDFVAGQWSYTYGGNAQPDAVLLDRKSIGTVDVQSGILLGGRNENNWYHWVIEYVARLAFDGTIPPAIPILVSDSVPEGFLEVISSFSEREIVRLPKKLDWRVESLFVAQPLAQILDSIVIPWEEGLSVNSEALGTFRDTVLRGHRTYPSPSKVFLIRNAGHRGLINQKTLRRAAETFGFTSVDPSTMTWNQQVNLFRNAKTVVGAGGAVMANYLFMPPNSKIVALTNEGLWDFVLPAQISAIAGAEFSYLLGIPKHGPNKTSVEQMHSAFKISLKSFKNQLKHLDDPPR